IVLHRHRRSSRFLRIKQIQYQRVHHSGGGPVRSLGASFFPVLANEDLTVFPDQVAGLLAECAAIRNNLEAVAPSTDPSTSHAEYVRRISQRLQNIETAAERAQNIGGGVLIW
ncbi:hypothetical protein, partial [Streptomyces sp. NPDC003863]